MGKETFRKLWRQIVPTLASISIEPVFFLDGFAFSNMVVMVESLQYAKICKVNLNYDDEICKNFDDFPDERNAYNAKVSSFKRNDGIITSIIPLFFILFIGAWSDKYGRKVPLGLTLFCHILFSIGYLLNSVFFNLSVDFLLGVGFLDSIGGGAVAFLTVANAYISDVTTTEQRTSRVALANSLWFLGGPLGTLIGTTIYKNVGYTAVFSTSLGLYVFAFIYVMVLLPESYGPFADKERLKKIAKPKPALQLRDTILSVYGLSRRGRRNTVGKTESEEERQIRKSITWKKMLIGFFDIKRVLLSFRCVFKKRQGFIRLFIFLLVLSNLLRKIGRGAYAFHFAKEVLKWEAEDYGYWATYKNILSTLGSLLAVPILSTKLKVSDNSLAMIGSVSSIMDYILYGLVTTTTFFLVWVGPAASILVNSCSIATRAMMSKYVSPEELGQVSAVTGTVEGIVPIISTTLYSAITESTFKTFPGAQYFFGACCNIVMALIFVLIMALDKSEDYDIEAAEAKVPKASVIEKGLVVEKAIVLRRDSNWLYDEKNNKIRLSTILLTDFNFSIEVPTIEKAYSKKNKKLSTISEVSNENIDDEVDPQSHRRNNGSIPVPITEIATLHTPFEENNCTLQIHREQDSDGTKKETKMHLLESAPKQLSSEESETVILEKRNNEDVLDNENNDNNCYNGEPKCDKDSFDNSQDSKAPKEIEQTNDEVTHNSSEKGAKNKKCETYSLKNVDSQQINEAPENKSITERNTETASRTEIENKHGEHSSDSNMAKENEPTVDTETSKETNITKPPKITSGCPKLEPTDNPRIVAEEDLVNQNVNSELDKHKNKSDENERETAVIKAERKQDKYKSSSEGKQRTSPTRELEAQTEKHGQLQSLNHATEDPTSSGITKSDYESTKLVNETENNNKRSNHIKEKDEDVTNIQNEREQTQESEETPKKINETSLDTRESINEKRKINSSLNSTKSNISEHKLQSPSTKKDESKTNIDDIESISSDEESTKARKTQDSTAQCEDSSKTNFGDITAKMFPEETMPPSTSHDTTASESNKNIAKSEIHESTSTLKGQKHNVRESQKGFATTHSQLQNEAANTTKNKIYKEKTGNYNSYCNEGFEGDTKT